MINTTETTQKQKDIVAALIAHLGKPMASRAELHAAYNVTHQRAYAPGFIVKNQACKVPDSNQWNLGAFGTPVVEKKKAQQKIATGAKRELSMTKDAIRKRAAKANKNGNLNKVEQPLVAAE